MYTKHISHWFKYVYGTPKKMRAAWPRLKLYNFNIFILKTFI